MSASDNDVMLAFIDDSGDPGFGKIGHGSTRYFVIAVVLFDDELEAEKAAVEIKDLRRKLFERDDVEFKFNSSSEFVRDQFFRSVGSLAFRIRAIVFDKTMVYSAELRNNPGTFYSYAIKTVLEHNHGRIANAKIRIDGGGDRRFRKRFLGYLRRELGSAQSAVLRNCKFENSKSSVLIQLADMVAGALRRFHEHPTRSAESHRAALVRHIEDEWLFN